MIKDFLDFRISKITIFFSVFILISTSFMRQVLEFIQSYIGGGGVKILLALIMIAASLAFLIFVMKKRVHAIKTPTLILLIILGLILAWQVKYPAEKVHILEYGLLGWLATKDLIKVNGKSKAIISAAIFCIVVGIIDEAFQAVLPYRFYDIRDIIFNGLGGIWGIVLYLLA